MIRLLDEERAAEVRALVHELAPEAVKEIIQPLHQVGMISGWRNVIDCAPTMCRLWRPQPWPLPAVPVITRKD